MKRTLTLWSVGILMFCGMLALASERTTAPVVDNVRLGNHADGHTRIVLDLSDNATFSLRPQSDNRLDIVIDNGTISDDAETPGDVGLVTGTQGRGGVISVALSQPALPARSFILTPREGTPHYRLVVDIEAATASAYRAAVEKAASLPPVQLAAEAAAPRPLPETPSEKTRVSQSEREAERAWQAVSEDKDVAQTRQAKTVIVPAPSLKPRREIKAEVVLAEKTTPPAPRDAPAVAAAAPTRSAPARRSAAVTSSSADGFTIVIDPGHGGHDPGAIGVKTGLREKDVTYRAADSLRKELEGRGYEVILTREGDEYVNLAERIEIARNRQADMFLSLHADANAVPEARGASVYTLSEDRSRRMAGELSRDGDFRIFDKQMNGESEELSKILFDLANTNTMNESDRLAEAMIREMSGRVQMVNNTHRRAGLVVLLSPDVPAVLVEMAFLSNSKDEANLGSARWRRQTMEAVADGIDKYFGNNPDRRAASTGGVAGGSP